MNSKESKVAAKVRLNQWALEIQDCMNRPKDMTVTEWCKQHNITKANYYRRLKRVRQACLERAEMSAGSFVELPVPTQCTVPSAPVPTATSPASSTAAILYTVSGISVEIMDNATAGFIKNLIGALANA